VISDFILDGDPGHDDAIALAIAAYRGRVLGVTTVAGNASVAQTTANALSVVQLLGLDIEVHAGAATPLNGIVGEYASFVHGENGMVGAVMPELTRQVVSNDAPGFLLDVTQRNPGAWIIAMGPMTNLAAALQRDPALVDRIAGISLMGGGTFGNITAAAEFNVHFDPEAADIVLRCGAPIVQCGLDVARSIRVTDAMIALVRGLDSTFGAFCGDLLAGYLANIRALTSADTEAALYDVCAVLAVTDPELFHFSERHVSVELEGEHTRGMTVVDQRSWMSGGAVKWANTIDVAGAQSVMVAALTAAP